MKKLLRPLKEMIAGYYESTTQTRVPRSKSRKIRKYEHIDVSKHFEKRFDDYDKEKRKILEEIYKKGDDKLIEEGNKIRQNMIEHGKLEDLVEIGEEDDIKSKYLVSGIRKMCILGVIKYHQLNHNLFDDSKLHPEVQKDFEKLHYLVENNFPVEKEMLFKLVPELFRFEINKLGVKDKLLFQPKRKGFLRADGDIYQVDTDYNKEQYLDTDYQMVDKIMTMEHYLLEQSADIYNLYRDRIGDYLIKNNYPHFYFYFQQLEVMDKDRMMDWEREFMNEVYQLRSIKEDIHALKKRYLEIQNTALILPEYIRSDRLKQKLISDHEYLQRYLVVDIRDTLIIPPPPNRGPSFDERLRIATGGKIDEFIKNDKDEFKRLANERVVPQQRNLNEKDDNLIKRLNIIAQAVKVEDPPLTAPDTEELYKNIKQASMASLPQDHRILVDEIYKVLFLNNQNPELYNVHFWSEHFKIEPSAIRNVFNYLAFPIFDEQSRATKKFLCFIDIDLVKNREKLKDVTRDDYISYLEEDYYRRVDIEHKEMQDRLKSKTLREKLIHHPNYEPGFGYKGGKVENPKQIISAVRIEKIIENDDIMRDLDKEVERFKKELEEEKSQSKNQMKF